MTTRVLPVFAALVTLAVVGCGKSPEKICENLEALEAKSKDKKEKADPAKDHERCVKDMAKMKETSATAYDCVGKCSEQSEYDPAMVCMLGCILGDEKLKAESEKEQKEKDAEREKKMLKWPELAAKPFEGSVQDFDKKETKFSVSLAEGFAEDATMKVDGMKSYELKDEELFSGPSVSVQVTFPQSVDDAAKSAEEIMKDKVVKKEKTDKGFVLTTTGEGSMSARVQIKIDENKALECKASLFNEKALAHKDKLLPWLEKMCASLAAK